MCYIGSISITTNAFFPIWHNIEKAELDAWNPGLSGIIGISTGRGLEFTIEKIAKRISENAPIRGVAPIWEDPYNRFLNGQGELHTDKIDGPVLNIFDAMTLDESYFPIFINGKNYKKAELAYYTALAIAHQSYDHRMKPLAHKLEAIINYCKSNGFDPEEMA